MHAWLFMLCFWVGVEMDGNAYLVLSVLPRTSRCMPVFMTGRFVFLFSSSPKRMEIVPL